MIKTVYICDRCNAEQATREQFWSIGVWASIHGAQDSTSSIDKRSLQVCRPCLEALGVHVQAVTKAAPRYVERTTEDILRELIERVQA